MMATLRSRRLLGSAVIATVFATSAAGLMSAIGTLRKASDRRGEADRLIALATHVERLVVDLETGQRGFILTGQDRFLQPWRRARRELPRRVAELQAAAASSSSDNAVVDEIARRVRSYAYDYVSRSVQTARRDLRRARAIVAGGEGKRRVDDLRARFDALVRARGADAVARAREADAAASTAITIAWAGIGASFLWLILFELYMGRAISRPLIRTGNAAGRIARGDLSAHVPESGPVELVRLATSFNHMARELQDGREKLERRNAELDEARIAAERANRAKSEFLSRMSHELRTPLNSILGFGQLLQMATPAPPSDRHVRQVLKAGRHLLDLIDELLDISRIESGRMSLSLEPVDAAGVVTELLELLGSMAAERHITLIAPEPAGTRWVRADQQRLRQVLLNLLSNAIKYNSEGGEVLVRVEPAESDRVRILVTDTGIGIAAEDLDRLFVAFDRLGAEQLGIEGTGLGLPLSKRLVELMQGTLEVSSEHGVGTTFAIELGRSEGPAVQPVDARGQPLATIAEAELPVARLLYIEDNISNVELMEQILADRTSIELMTAATGGLGIELAKSRVPDLVLLDLHLPDIPGEEVLARLRAGDRTRHVPVIIVSADASHRHIARLRAAGADAYLTKPLDVQCFLDVIAEHLPARPAVTG